MATKTVLKSIGREVGVAASIVVGIMLGMIVLTIFWPDTFSDVHNWQTLVASLVLGAIMTAFWVWRDYRTGRFTRW